jgi:PAS domain S-box-containing protein
MVIVDRAGHIVLANGQAERLFGYDRGALVGQTVETLIPARLRGHHPGHRRRYFDEPRPRPMLPTGIELIGLRRDGSEFPAEISLSPLETEGGLLAMTAIRETTERKKLEEERVRLGQAQEAVRLRDEFLSIAAHELRTPLTALQLQLDGLGQALAAVEPPARAGYARVAARLDKALRNTARLTDLVNTLLDLSRIMGGRLRLRLEATDLAAVVRDVTEDFYDPSERAPCPVSIEAPERVVAVCDRSRFEQIFTNLLSNASKYGQGKPIAVRLHAGADGVELSVRDHGMGIAPDDLDRIFHKFERAAAARNHGGMGLGLYISRYLAEAHGGTIQVTSTLGDGATFVVRIPLRPGDEPQR